MLGVVLAAVLLTLTGLLRRVVPLPHGVALAGGVEGEQGFVGKHKLRILREGLCLADELLLPAGKKADALVGEVGRADACEEFIDVSFGWPAVRDAVCIGE